MQSFFTQGDFLPVKALRQRWQQKSFSYLHYPRPDHGLMLLLNGRIDFAWEGGILRAQAGDLIYLPQGCLYEAIFRTELGAIDNYLINFTTSAPAPCPSPQRLLDGAPRHLKEQFGQFITENYPSIARPLRSRGLLYLLLDEVFRSRPHIKTQRDQTLEKALAFLEGELSIREIACRCSVSESSLRQLFQEKMQLSPTRCRLQMKVRRAQYLLESTDMTVNEISDALGFFDAAYFCRVFREHTGMTPKNYAKNKKL